MRRRGGRGRPHVRHSWLPPTTRSERSRRGRGGIAWRGGGGGNPQTGAAVEPLGPGIAASRPAAEGAVPVRAAPDAEEEPGDAVPAFGVERDAGGGSHRGHRGESPSEAGTHEGQSQEEECPGVAGASGSAAVPLWGKWGNWGTE